MHIADVIFEKIKNYNTDKLFEEVYQQTNSELYWRMVGELHSRGSQIIFNRIKELSISQDSKNREIAADLLGQLRKGKELLFHNESVNMLIEFLNDPNETVIESAAFSLGHRHDLSAIEQLLRLVNHINPDIREGVVSGLSGLEDKRAINGLIQLSQDDDYDVQNWAVFGLASQCKMDTKEIRQALIAHINNEDCEIRGEAFIGLAMRQDKRVKLSIIKELKGEFHGTWVLDAVIEMPDSDYLPYLLKLHEHMIKDNEEQRFIVNVEEAIKACQI